MATSSPDEPAREWPWWAQVMLGVAAILLAYWVLPGFLHELGLELSTPTPSTRLASLRPIDPAAESLVTPSPSAGQPHPPAAPATPAYLLVGNTSGEGVFIRRTPKSADRIRAWPDDTKMLIVGPETSAEGRAWKNVRDPDGNVGWVPASYLMAPPGATTAAVLPTCEPPPVAGTSAATPSGPGGVSRPTESPSAGPVDDPLVGSQPVTVEDVRWRILKAYTAPQLPTTSGGTRRTDGTYVVVALEVVNLARASKVMDNLELNDSKGRKFASVSRNALWGIDPKPLVAALTLGPGVPLRFSEIFDVPRDARELTLLVSNLGPVFIRRASIALVGVE